MYVKRLSVDQAVDRGREELAERGGVDVGWRERGFGKIRAEFGIGVVVREDVDREHDALLERFDDCANSGICYVIMMQRMVHRRSLATRKKIGTLGNYLLFIDCRLLRQETECIEATVSTDEN